MKFNNKITNIIIKYQQKNIQIIHNQFIFCVELIIAT